MASKDPYGHSKPELRPFLAQFKNYYKLVFQ